MTARVLVVDDIVANVRLLEAKLTAEYFEVVTAMNGLDALEAVQRSKPDIILLDVMMPGIDGIEVCSRLKSNPATRHIPVIMVTALDQPEDRLRGLNAVTASTTPGAMSRRLPSRCRCSESSSRCAEATGCSSRGSPLASSASQRI